MQVMTSLVDLKDRKPAIGFIRADQTIDAKRYADLLEENQKLRDAAAKMESSTILFDGADDKFKFEIANSDKTITTARSLGELFVITANQ